LSTLEIVTLVASILVAGWFSAFITQAVKQATWPSSVKLVVSALVALSVAAATSWLAGDLLNFVTVWQSGGLTANEVIVYFTGVFASAATWYRFYFKDATWAENLLKWPSK
jgi:hypothetical protein